MVALFGMAAIPAVSGAVQPRRTTSVSVSVKPRAGSARTHFAVSFRAGVSTGRSFHNVYRVTASGPRRGRCEWSVAVAAPPTKAGSTVHVALKPSGSKHWCAGAYEGQVWDVIVESCPVGKACPAIEPAPHLVGKFTFRVTRG